MKPFCTSYPIHSEVFYQERSDYHSHTLCHPKCIVMRACDMSMKYEHTIDGIQNVVIDILPACLVQLPHALLPIASTCNISCGGGLGTTRRKYSPSGFITQPKL